MFHEFPGHGLSGIRVQAGTAFEMIEQRRRKILSANLSRKYAVGVDGKDDLGQNFQDEQD